MTFCSSCATKAVDGASFCHQCGFSFGSADVTVICRGGWTAVT